MNTSNAYRARVAHDAIGAAVHPVVAGLLFGAKKSTTIKLLIAQEIVAGLFHVIYCLWHAQIPVVNSWFGPAKGMRNSGKWVEYALSATLGTVAVLYASEQHIDWWWVTLLCSTCVSQQLIGYTLDHDQNSMRIQWANFFIAWILQVCEFLIILSLPTTPASTNEEIYSLRVVYVVSWSSFGCLALIDLLKDQTLRFTDYWNDTIEATYACLSWTSKLAVVGLSVYSKIYVAVIILIFALICVLATWKLIQPKYALTQNDLYQ